MKSTTLKQKFEFVRGGIAAKTGKPYLAVSNGRDTFYPNIPASLGASEHTFSSYEDGDEIELHVKLHVGDASVSLVELPLPKKSS